MDQKKLGIVVAILACSLAAVGYSFYRTYMVGPENNLTPEQKEAAMKAAAAFTRGPKYDDPKAPPVKP